MMAVAALLRSAILPHLSHDWEAGRRERVAERMNLTIKASGLCFWLPASPSWPWRRCCSRRHRGKFAGGMEVLPLTLTFMIWFCPLPSPPYLWRRRAGQGNWAFRPGCSSTSGSSVLAPRYGLMGVVIATAAAHFLTLLATYYFNHRLGCEPTRAPGSSRWPRWPAGRPDHHGLVLMALAHQRDAFVAVQRNAARAVQDVTSGLLARLGAGPAPTAKIVTGSAIGERRARI